MLYVCDRRIWIWLTPSNGASHINMALSTNRKTMDGDREFTMLADKLIGPHPYKRRLPEVLYEHRNHDTDTERRLSRPPQLV